MSVSKLLIVCLHLCWTCSLSAQEQETKAVAGQVSAQITFDEQTFDFGEFSISKSLEHEHTFEFTNTGGSDLYILQAVSGCGCTTPVYTKVPVKPGEKGRVVVKYNAKGQNPGPFRKSVTIYTNDPRSYTRLFVKGVKKE